MYVPDSFRCSNPAALEAFIGRHSFATVITHNKALSVSHLPLIFRPTEGAQGALVGHMARANTHWKAFDGSRNTLCVFHGPHSYISPSWYEAQPAVPTWNYAVVHVSGRPRIVEDHEWLSALMDETIRKFEPSLLDPNAYGHTPSALRNELLQHIVGFTLAVDDIQGKFKLGQNRSRADQHSIAQKLRDESEEGHALADLMVPWLEAGEP